MNALSALSGFTPTTETLLKNNLPAPTSEQAQVKETFQDFVAGTVFKEMLKSLRKTHQEAAYLNGGHAEKTFRQQLDQKIAEDLAHEHGAAFAEPLFDVFSARMKAVQLGVSAE